MELVKSTFLSFDLSRTGSYFCNTLTLWTQVVSLSLVLVLVALGFSGTWMDAGAGDGAAFLTSSEVLFFSRDFVLFLVSLVYLMGVDLYLSFDGAASSSSLKAGMSGMVSCKSFFPLLRPWNYVFHIFSRSPLFAHHWLYS